MDGRPHGCRRQVRQRIPSCALRCIVWTRKAKGADPSFMKGDFVFNRWLRMWHTKLRHFKLFKTYYK